MKLWHLRKERGEYRERNDEVQKRNPAFRGGIKPTAKAGRGNGDKGFPVSSDADYEPPQRLSGHPAGIKTAESGNQPYWCKYQSDCP